jgi:UDP-N-acetyl-alpha-D-muramoyl-L-alanyl-L-glutamate epimerase
MNKLPIGSAGCSRLASVEENRNSWTPCFNTDLAGDMKNRVLSLVSVTWNNHQLVLRFALGDIAFSTVYWYPDISLLDLDRRYGRDFMERVHVHTALFEINKIASFRPRVIDLGQYSKYHTEALERLWRTVFHKVWAQWRYENDLPLEEPPPWTSRPTQSKIMPVHYDRPSDEILLFCGGGKDSLVSMKLLERGNLPFASFTYSSSVYGASRPQFELIDRLLDRGASRRRHRTIVVDDFFDAPMLELYGNEIGVKSVTAAETPSSIFGAMPILLDRGYSCAVLGNEASANKGNLIWDKTGEDVNHQWGKSVEAERLLDEYIRTELCADMGVFSLLMPIHDAVIFSLLEQDQDILPFAHSCNIEKPWCRRCAKCAYVWLGYRAHLPASVVESIFEEDLLEAPENYAFFHDMVGLGAHTPFECIGQIDESRLALSLCKARGLLGPRGCALAERLPSLDIPAVLQGLLHVDLRNARLPAAIADAVAPQMYAAATECRCRIRTLLPSVASENEKQST